MRYEWLSQYFWEDLDEVRLFATQWMYNYNHHRPHMALGGFTPKQRLANWPLAALAGFAITARAYDMDEFLGLRQWRRHDRGTDDREPSPCRRCTASFATPGISSAWCWSGRAT